MKSYYNYKSIQTKVFISGLMIFSLFLSSSLHSQSLTVQSPNGGEVWNYGGTEIATWTGNNLGSIMTIEFSYDGGTNWWYMGEVPSGPNGGSAMLSVPNTSTENAVLRITDSNQPAATDVSDEPFTVYVPPVVIYAPTPASYVFVHTEVFVNWGTSVEGITLLNAEISVDNGVTYTPVAENINALLYYTYLVLSDTPSDSCILKLYNAEDPSEFGLSDVFTISPLPVYSLISPAAGEYVNTNSPYTISWTVENSYSPYCYLEYSMNNGQTWEVISGAISEGNSGSYEWITPNVDSEECLVRIGDSYAISSMDTSGVFTIFTFPETPICIVSVDSVTSYNVVIWERPVSDIIADFLVYKETDEANVYEVIDTVGYEEITMVTDSSSNPAIRPYRYKIGFIDVENRLFPAGDYHQTVHLTINQGVNGAWNLIWTPYIGFDYSSYKIMRKTDSDDFEQIATVSASFSSYTDLNAPPGEVYYMIKIEHPDGCNPAARDGEYASVFSNVATNSLVSVAESKDLDFSIYPIPVYDRINVSFGEKITGKARLSITDLTGRVVYSQDFNDVRPGQVQVINTRDFREGMYMLQITTDKSRNTRKILIRH
jgi:hypothetical protein